MLRKTEDHVIVWPRLVSRREKSLGRSVTLFLRGPLPRGEWFCALRARTINFYDESYNPIGAFDTLRDTSEDVLRFIAEKLPE